MPETTKTTYPDISEEKRKADLEKESFNFRKNILRKKIRTEALDAVQKTDSEPENGLNNVR